MKETYKVIYAPAAVDDLKGIFSYIAYELEAGDAARNQTDRIRKAIRTLDEMPARFGKAEWEPWASMGMHKLPVDNYVVFYLVNNEQRVVTVIRIFYGGRDVENIIKLEKE